MNPLEFDIIFSDNNMTKYRRGIQMCRYPLTHEKNTPLQHTYVSAHTYALLNHFLNNHSNNLKKNDQRGSGFLHELA